MVLIYIKLAFMVVAVLTDLSNERPGVRPSWFQEMLRTQCRRNNAEDEIAGLKTTGNNLVSCIEGLIDMRTIEPRYRTSEQFIKSYCNKNSQMKNCIYPLLDAMSPCLNAREQEHVEPAKNLTSQVIDYICYKDAERITRFVSGGEQCLHDTVDDIVQCVIHFVDHFTNTETAKSLSTADQCTKIDELTNCVVNKLESCNTTTQANLAASLFRFVRQKLPCE